MNKELIKIAKQNKNISEKNKDTLSELKDRINYLELIERAKFQEHLDREEKIKTTKKIILFVSSFVTTILTYLYFCWYLKDYNFIIYLINLISLIIITKLILDK